MKVRSASLCHSDLMLLEPNDQGLKLGEGEPFTMVCPYGFTDDVALLTLSRATKGVEQSSRSAPKLKASNLAIQ